MKRSGAEREKHPRLSLTSSEEASGHVFQLTPPRNRTSSRTASRSLQLATASFESSRSTRFHGPCSPSDASPLRASLQERFLRWLCWLGPGALVCKPPVVDAVGAPPPPWRTAESATATCPPQPSSRAAAATLAPVSTRSAAVDIHSCALPSLPAANLGWDPNSVRPPPGYRVADRQEPTTRPRRGFSGGAWVSDADLGTSSRFVRCRSALRDDHGPLLQNVSQRRIDGWKHRNEAATTGGTISGRQEAAARLTGQCRGL